MKIPISRRVGIIFSDRHDDRGGRRRKTVKSWYNSRHWRLRTPRRRQNGLNRREYDEIMLKKIKSLAEQAFNAIRPGKKETQENAKTPPSKGKEVKDGDFNDMYPLW